MAILEYLITDIGYDHERSAIIVKWTLDNKVTSAMPTGNM